MKGSHAADHGLPCWMRVTPATTFSTVPTGGVISPIELLMTNSTPK